MLKVTRKKCTFKILNLIILTILVYKDVVVTIKLVIVILCDTGYDAYGIFCRNSVFSSVKKESYNTAALSTLF